MAFNTDFSSEPIADKPVTALSGIGELLGRRLTDKGFDKVCVSFNMFFFLSFGHKYLTFCLYIE